MKKRRGKQSIDGIYLDKLLDQKVWTDAILADKAEVSERTIERGRKGELISNDKINSIAKAFEITPDKLLRRPSTNPIYYTATGHDIKLNENTETRSYINILTSINYNYFNNVDVLIDFQDVLSSEIHARGIVIASVLSRSVDGTLLSIEMDKADIIRLVALMIGGTHKNLNILRIDLLDDLWFKRALVLEKWMGTPVDVDDNAWSELLNSGEIDAILNNWFPSTELMTTARIRETRERTKIKVLDYLSDPDMLANGATIVDIKHALIKEGGPKLADEKIVLGELEAAGLVDRQQVPSYGKAKPYFISESGRKYLAESKQKATSAETGQRQDWAASLAAPDILRVMADIFRQLPEFKGNEARIQEVSQQLVLAIDRSNAPKR